MNVILIALDTLRADHLGCYGYRRVTSPNLDTLAKEGVVFENLWCEAIPTQPSYTTTFTGREPLDHGIVAHGGTFPLREECPTLPELAKAAGHRTACVSLLPHMKPWFAKGWDEAIEAKREEGAYPQMVTAEEINGAALPWLATRAKPPFFLFLHYWDAHTPYLPPLEYRRLFYDGDPSDPNAKSMAAFQKQPFAEWWTKKPEGKDAFAGWLLRLAEQAGVKTITDAEYIAAQYDAEIKYLDDRIADLTNGLKRHGFYDDTALVFFADHGEEMYERGIYFDHHGLYDANLHVPLIVRMPGGEHGGRRVRAHARHTDILPTILDLVGGKAPEQVVGKSLLPLVRGGEPGDWRDGSLLTLENSWMSKWALRRGDHHFILAREKDWHGFPPRELYHLASDPGLTRNLVWSEERLADDMHRDLESRIAAGLKKYGRTADPLVEQGLSPMGKRAWEWISKSRYW